MRLGLADFTVLARAPQRSDGDPMRPLRLPGSTPAYSSQRAGIGCWDWKAYPRFRWESPAKDHRGRSVSLASLVANTTSAGVRACVRRVPCRLSFAGAGRYSPLAYARRHWCHLNG